MLSFSTLDPFYLTLALAGTFILAFLSLSILRSFFAKHNHPLAETFSALRSLVLPSIMLLLVVRLLLKLSAEETTSKIVSTLLWVSVLWTVISLLKVFIFTKQAENENWKSRIPGLLVDIIRFAMILIGSGLVVTGVWGGDLGAFLTTLGVGSIVLGLALQDTLGNLISGIALLFERPFAAGEWIKVGETIGEVVEMNWRSVRLRTRELNALIVPNSVLVKEKIVNFSRPTEATGAVLNIGFSYDDAPNKAKAVLLETVINTPGVLEKPKPSIYTQSYGDFSVNYTIRFYVKNYADIHFIEEDFFTRLWYAVRREGLTIPYPTSNTFEAKISAPVKINVSEEAKQAISKVDLFSEFSNDEILKLAEFSRIQEFSQNEYIVKQGQAGESLYIISKGEVQITDGFGASEQELTKLCVSDFFGEMSLLTGALRSASAKAYSDCTVIEVAKPAFAAILEKRPDIAESIAKLVLERREKLINAQTASREAYNKQTSQQETSTVLATRIRKFLGI